MKLPSFPTRLLSTLGVVLVAGLLSACETLNPRPPVDIAPVTYAAPRTGTL